MSSTMLDTAFDVPNEEGSPPITPLPAGKYTAEITSASVGETKNRKGTAVSLGWTVTEGDFDKRMVFQNILIQHESADAQKFGRQKMKDVCTACGIVEPLSDLDVLLYKPCQISVAIRKDESGEYGDRNEVKRVAPAVASWNGPKPVSKMSTAAALKEATTTPKAFEAVVDKNLNDEIPWK